MEEDTGITGPATRSRRKILAQQGDNSTSLEVNSPSTRRGVLARKRDNSISLEVSSPSKRRGILAQKGDNSVSLEVSSPSKRRGILAQKGDTSVSVEVSTPSKRRGILAQKGDNNISLEVNSPNRRRGILAKKGDNSISLEVNSPSKRQGLRKTGKLELEETNENNTSKRSLNECVTNMKKVDNDNCTNDNTDAISDKTNIEENITEKKIQQNYTISEILAQHSSGDIKVFVENLDSNPVRKQDTEFTSLDTEDQCVPLVENLMVNFSQNKGNSDRNEQNNFDIDLCEPMDVDEIIQNNLKMPEKESNWVSPEKKLNSIPAQIESNLSNIQGSNISENSPRFQELKNSHIETKNTSIVTPEKYSPARDISNTAESRHLINIKQLSKSLDYSNDTHRHEAKKKLSLHYSTSTPLQEEKIQKFNKLPMNTLMKTSQNSDHKKEDLPIAQDNLPNCTDSSGESEIKEPICHDNKSENREDEIDSIAKTTDNQLQHIKEVKKMDSDITLNKSSADISTLDDDLCNVKLKNILIKDKNSKRNLSISSSDDSVNENESLGKSNFINDEVDDAGDDYESGDSQDENEREYEEQNEIIDHGETLSTEGELSNDSDYEKGSFIVSSNEEDEELLDGTGDDLSSSDNELQMTNESKRKFDARKAKEQKRASREMFESRHKLNSSKISKSKKSKLRYLSSSSESEQDIPVKSKRKNILRLDSSAEKSLIVDESEQTTSKKNNSLSSTMNNASALNEMEITINNENLKQSDPLSVEIKEEAKTPAKSANSTIAFVDTEENTDQIDKNESTKTQTEFLDPLEGTINNESDSSDSEKINNYDAILKGLNNISKIKKIKTCDISLNNNERKIKRKTTIIDELNLTQTKSYTKKKAESQAVTRKSSLQKVSKSDQEDVSSSDSIDLHLLFSEESNNSNGTEIQSNINVANVEDCIPLKRIKGKTDLLADRDTTEEVTSTSNTLEDLNETFKKAEKNPKVNETDNDGVTDISDDSKKKKRVKKSSSNFTPPVQVQLAEKHSTKEQKKKLSLNEPNDEIIPEEAKIFEEQLKETEIIPKKKKRKISWQDDGHESDVISEPKLEPIGKSDKKKKIKLSSQENILELDLNPDTKLNEIQRSERKKKQKISSQDKIIEQDSNPEGNSNGTHKSDKKKKRKISSLDEVVVSDFNPVVKLKETHRNEKKEKSKISSQDKVVASEPKVKKRKVRDEEDEHPVSKVKKVNFFTNVKPLPTSLLVSLEDKKQEPTKRNMFLSTSRFNIQQVNENKNKPSNYLEESILDPDDCVINNKKQIIVPKILPTIPTASTSSSGFTTKFTVNIIPEKFNFSVTSNITSFRDKALYGKRIKRQNTYDLFKRQRNVKLSKF